MRRNYPKMLPTAFLLLLMVSCHPEGCYGPKAFGYNTKGVVVSNLVGNYTFDGTNAPVLNKHGFSSQSGFIILKPDMSFICSNVPCIMGIPKSGVFFSATGRWNIVKSGAIHEVLLYDADPSGLAGYFDLRFPVLSEYPPHGIELAINHAEGYWIRYRRSQEAQ